MRNLLFSSGRVVDDSFGLITCTRFWIRKTVTSEFSWSVQEVLDVINLLATSDSGRCRGRSAECTVHGVRDCAKDEDYFGHTIQITLSLEPRMRYKDWVQCDVLTQCAHLHMHYETVLRSQEPQRTIENRRELERI